MWLRVILAFVVGISGHTLSAANRPNLVFLLVDDLRWNTLGFMGDPIVQTPHLDRLANEGIVFRNAFVTTSICSVSRASYLTGQWMRRHRVEDFATGLKGPAWEQTYPAQLRATGYRTGFIGKYGVGNAREVAAKEPAFDFWRGLPGQGGAFIEPNDPTGIHKTALFGNQALEFLKECRDDQPFCLSISFNAVHARDGQPREYVPDPRDEALYRDVTIPLPALATQEAFERLPVSVQKSEGRKRWGWRFDTPEKAQMVLRDYYRLITGVDREIGRIRETLAKRDFDQNTVIVFTSDNGYALADRGLADKWYMYEEDIRIPFVLYDPRIPLSERHAVYDQMVLNVDLAPTLLDLAGVPIPTGMQGKSLKPFINRAVPERWRTQFFYEHVTEAKRIPPSEGIRTVRWKYLRWTQENPAKEELYDLKADPLEETNLVDNPQFAGMLKELRQKWQAEREALR